jgi:hypothetical protein
MAAGVGGGVATGAFARTRPTAAPVPTTASAPVTTATFTFTATVSGLTRHGGPITVSGSGQADFGADAVSVSVDLPAAVAALLPGGSASPEVVEAVLSGGNVYLEVPGLAGLVGAPWISVALPAGATSGIPGGFTMAASALGNVNEILAFARSHHAGVTSLGSSTVDGTAVDGSRVAGRLSGFRLTGTLWADASTGRLVRAVVAASRGAGHRGLGLSATVDLSGYGAPVTITVPPPSQVKAIPLSVVEQFLGGVLPRAHLAPRRHAA